MRVVRLVEIMLGLVFVASAALKALDVPSFAIQVSYYGILKDPLWVRLAALSTVGFEGLIGAALLTGFRLRGLSWAATLAMLVVFTILIAYAWVYKNLQDCGCFGKYLKLTPGVSIVKNGVMLGFVCAAWIANGWSEKRLAPGTWVSPGWRYVRTFLAALVIVVLVGVVAYANSWEDLFGKAGRPGGRTGTRDPDRPFAQFVFDLDDNHWDLGRGEYLVAMLSTTCDQCRAAVETLNELILIPQMPPLIALMLGEENDLEDFRAVTQPEFPTTLIDPLVFLQLIGVEPPRLIYVLDGRQVLCWDEELPAIPEIVSALEASGGWRP
jgi:hypothetical protein